MPRTLSQLSNEELSAREDRYYAMSQAGPMTGEQVGRWMEVQQELSARCAAPMQEAA